MILQPTYSSRDVISICSDLQSFQNFFEPLGFNDSSANTAIGSLYDNFTILTVRLIAYAVVINHVCRATSGTDGSNCLRAL